MLKKIEVTTTKVRGNQTKLLGFAGISRGPFAKCIKILFLTKLYLILYPFF